MKHKILTLILMFSLALAGCGGDEASSSSVSSLEEASPALSVSQEESDFSQEASEESAEESSEESEESLEEPSESSEEISEESSEESLPEEEEKEEIFVIPGFNQNPLTGLYTVTDGGVGKRPVAIMVNNIEYSLPQYGIASADIIFEMPAEGGLTRFMAMYADYTNVPQVCSVRSCRKYFPAISEGFDAVYVNCGMNDVIRDYVKSLNLTQYDGYYDSRLFARDKDRLNQGYAYEHTMYFDGPRLPEIMEKDGKRTDLEADKLGTAFKFNGFYDAVNPSDKACERVVVDFGYNESGFTYDSVTRKYYKDFNGDPQMDGRAERQLSFTNVIILETDIGNDENGLHREVNWYGGSGYYGFYISNGFVQKITWSKAGEESRLMLYDLDGNELSINCGNSYIAISFIGETYFY